MLTELFLNISLLGAEWVLYLLLILSILSITLIFDRIFFYRRSNKDIQVFHQSIRNAAEKQNWEQALKEIHNRQESQGGHCNDFATSLASSLIKQHSQKQDSKTDVYLELSHDSILQTRLNWEKHLSILATIGSNAPFIGLFGTVLGIIQAFHQLAIQTGQTSGPQLVMSAVSEALIATGFGILVAIPAVVAFNLFQRKVRAAVTEAESLKSFLIAKLGK